MIRCVWRPLRKTNIVLGQPRLVVSVGDARGIGAIHAPEVNGNVLSVEPGLGISGYGAGIHMPMPALAEDNKPLEIALFTRSERDGRVFTGAARA
ncbi:inner membrane protein CreD [Klebsiella pneumoniae]|uniref:Inner membrane protein CreD n=1 Tax=Klebsiella pneumoniae TaxID=573 RepID=A0A377ZM24_KLEPN|nr:inner membrane protein CreD [Klebsiella pneumoniae]